MLLRTVRKSLKNQVFIVLCASLGAFNFGYTLGFSFPALPIVVSNKVLTEAQAGWLCSLLTLGAVVGGPLSAWCIDRLGCKNAVLFSSVPVLLGYSCMNLIIKRKARYLVVGRFLTGVGSGMMCVCVPMYIADIASRTRRGVLGSCFEVFVVVGILAAFLQGLGKDWLRITFTPLLPALLASLCAYMMPESPRCLLARNRKREALEVLSSIRGEGSEGKGGGGGLTEEFRDMEEGVRTQGAVSWEDLLTLSELRRPLVLCVALLVLQQLTGWNAWSHHTATALNALQPDHAYLASVLVGLVKVPVTLLACLLTDRAGRTLLLKVGGAVMGVSLLLFGLSYEVTVRDIAAAGGLAGTPGVSGGPWFPVACLATANVGFSIGWGAVPFLFVAEVFPARSRAKAGAVATACYWLAGYFVSKEFSTLEGLLGKGGVFVFFALCCFLAVGFVCRYMPETRGRSLEDVQQLILHRRGAKR